MVEFGDEFMIESYRIPWLIWIQLLVMILLIILLYFGFTLTSTSEPSTTSAAVASGGSQPTTGCNAAPLTRLNDSTSFNRITTPMSPQVEAQTTQRDSTTSRGSSREDNNQSGEESSLKDSKFWRIFRHPNHHPCNYIGLAKQALFKCLGLDSSSESSSNCQHEKRE